MTDDCLRKNFAAAINGHNEMAVALSKIALGRTDCGRPLGGEDARQMARGVLIALGLDWNRVLKVNEDMRPAHEALRRKAR